MPLRGLLAALHEQDKSIVARIAVEEFLHRVDPAESHIVVAGLCRRRRWPLARQQQASVRLAVHQFGVRGSRAPNQQHCQRQGRKSS